jgi:hypothetical protein
MSEIDTLLQEFRVTAYFHGHVHSLESCLNIAIHCMFYLSPAQKTFN